MKTIKVSVCISVHNTAHLLPRCLDSLLKQTMKDLEIVLVNNGSSDNSEDIMRQYSNHYPQIQWQIIVQEDRGLAQGRQTGINHAIGEYIAFLDADDYVDSHMYGKLYDVAIENSADIVECEVFRDGSILSSPYTGLYDANFIFRDYLLYNSLHSMLWMRLYKRTLFQKDVMPELYVNNEDMFALPCLLYTAKTIYFLKEPLYYYTTDNEIGVMKVTTNNPAFRQKYYENRLKALLCFKHLKSFVGVDIEKYFTEYAAWRANFLFGFLFTNFYKKSYSDKLESLAINNGFRNGKDVELFIVQNISKDSKNYKNISLFGLRIYYYIHLFKNKLISSI